MDHAAPVFAVTTAFMVLLAIPSIFLSVEQNQLADAPGQAEAVQAGRVLQDSLGGAVNPDVYVIDTGRSGGVYEAANFAALGDFAKRLSAQTAVVKAVTWPTDKTAAEIRAGGGDGFVDETGRYALMNVAPYGDSLSNSARDLNDRLKQEKPVIEGAIPDSEVTLTGDPALQNDFNDAVYAPFPYLVLLVLVLAYLALLRAFRSVVLPLKAVVLNLLSILATYGLLVIVFQWGFGASLLGVDHDVRGIAPWIPVFLFAFLFGLSMDYEVFLISRMRELHDGGLDTRDSVSQGLARTGRIVTSAALVMVVAFSGFIIGSSTDLKEFGFGLAAAIAIDATIVRILLVPSLMRLLRRWNWYLPARVARSPGCAGPHARSPRGSPGRLRITGASRSVRAVRLEPFRDGRRQRRRLGGHEPRELGVGAIEARADVARPLDLAGRPRLPLAAPAHLRETTDQLGLVAQGPRQRPSGLGRGLLALALEVLEVPQRAGDEGRATRRALEQERGGPEVPAQQAPEEGLVEHGYEQQIRLHRGREGQLCPGGHPRLDGRPEPHRARAQALVGRGHRVGPARLPGAHGARPLADGGGDLPEAVEALPRHGGKRSNCLRSM